MQHVASAKKINMPPNKARQSSQGLMRPAAERIGMRFMACSLLLCLYGTGRVFPEVGTVLKKLMI
jgi:hypothetical protein